MFSPLYDNSASYLIVLPYLECLHKFSNKKIFFPDKYRMLFSSRGTGKVNSILYQKIMLQLLLQLENCLL
jgi:hypothetical protein